MQHALEDFDKINSEKEFKKRAFDLYNYQIKVNSLYAKFAQLILNGKTPSSINEIPFLPIDFFKKNNVICENHDPQKTFLSSGTQGIRSKHLISDITLYEKSFLTCFDGFYGAPSKYCILALIPTKHDINESSLIYMMNELIKKSKHTQSGIYNDYDKIFHVIKDLEKKGTKTLLFGVSYALLDLAEKYPQKLTNTTIIETGGMKGKRKEIIKKEFHSILKKSFDVDQIHSEYGMTELLSQAYSFDEGIFKCPKWMKILIRDVYDPLCVERHGKGLINIIDLANIYSCPFIATSDLGEVYENGSFQIMGRAENSDIRGCNLLME